MLAWMRYVLDGRLVLVTAVCWAGFQLFVMALAKPRGIEDQLLAHNTEWAAGMAVVLGWALASVRRGPGKGRWAAGVAMLVSLAGVIMVMIQQVRYIR